MKTAVLYEVTSGRACSIDGLGYLEADETMTFDDEDERRFERMNKIRLAQARFPHDVKVTVVLIDLDEEGQ